MVASLDQNEAAAEPPSPYTVGYSWRSTVIPADSEIPYSAWERNLDQMVSRFVISSIRLELSGSRPERRSMASGPQPKVATTPASGLKGELHRRWNAYDGGLSTPNNRTGWSLDLGVEIPVFDGFLTTPKSPKSAPGFSS